MHKLIMSTSSSSSSSSSSDLSEQVFRHSPLIEKLLNPELRGWLLGDSAYPCLPTLMTPYKDNGHLTAAEISYNAKLSSCRVRVEHTIGILKQR
ncbi:hypothetical protein ALC60_12469 [Trachymyrmex zeteki]|uniref:DDE Tnp4 domain-containing protein n=1 Tax=Mycetomoellerius zeteki TaxID=64791 RepID=A0A151WKV0_9HYME|nr:hypothetical protein ALC60_12469 [Trachymyrmex zeteki]